MHTDDRLSVCRFVRSIFGTGMVSTCTTAIVIDQGGGTDHPSSEDRIGSGVTDPGVGALESESGEKCRSAHQPVMRHVF